MKVCIWHDPDELGRQASAAVAALLREAIAARGAGRLILSTGASQFETLRYLVREDVDWGRVTMFHLDEYIALPETHPASFRRYLRERFTERVKLGAVHWVDGNPAVLTSTIAVLTQALRRQPVDAALVGIGENAHIAFNDPPADFGATEAFRVVELDGACRRQQVGEGWYTGIEEVPARAVTMTVSAIMAARAIVSAVPHAVKAGAVKAVLEPGVSESVPASILKTHPSWTLMLDEQSASLLDRAAFETA